MRAPSAKVLMFVVAIVGCILTILGAFSLRDPDSIVDARRRSRDLGEKILKSATSAENATPQMQALKSKLSELKAAEDVVWRKHPESRALLSNDRQKSIGARSNPRDYSAVSELRSQQYDIQAQMQQLAEKEATYSNNPVQTAMAVDKTSLDSMVADYERQHSGRIAVNDFCRGIVKLSAFALLVLLVGGCFAIFGYLTRR